MCGGPMYRRWGGGSEPHDRPYTNVDLHGIGGGFNLDYACLAAGLVPGGAKTPHALFLAVRRVFSCDVQRFLDAAAGVGCDQQAICDAAARLDIVHAADAGSAPGFENAPICTDLALTVAVLSRLTGSMVLRDRPPVLTWDQLFGRVVRIPEPIAPCTNATLGPVQA